MTAAATTLFLFLPGASTSHAGWESTKESPPSLSASATPAPATSDSPAPSSARPAPYRSDAALARAEALMVRGNFAAAIEMLETLLERDPSNDEAYAYLGQAWLSLGQKEEGLKNLERALTANPKHLGARLALGEYHLSQGDTARGFEALQALRLACGKKDCPERDLLESKLNRMGN